MPHESWLRGDDPDKFAKAAMACEGYTPNCVAHEMCFNEGTCFRSAGKADRVGAKAILAAASHPDVAADVATAMTEAAEWLRARSKSDGQLTK